MLQVVFNELSLQQQAQSEGHAIAVYQQFFHLVDIIEELKIAPVRVLSTLALGSQSIDGNYYTLKTWISNLQKDKQRRYIAYLVQQSLITDNPYFYYQDKDAVGLGYAFLNDLLAVSYATNNVWIADTYEIRKDYLADADLPVEEEMVTVHHGQIIIKADASEELAHKDCVREAYNQRQGLQAESIQSIADLWARKNEIFPYLEFAEEVEIQLHNYGSIKDSHVTKALHYLRTLNQHLAKVTTGNAKLADIPGEHSNDSEATLKEFHAVRTFTYPPGISKLYSLHVKLGDLRIYLMPFANEGKYIVGYIGKHLPTKKFAK